MSLLLVASLAYASDKPLPKNAFILPVSAGPDLLNQCSRDTPQNVTEFWVPTSEQIGSLERRIDDFFTTWHPPERTGIPPGKLERYHRQYLGIVVDGKHLIYGNFYDLDYNPSENEAQKPVIICDGGPYIFGLEYDPDQRKIIDAQVNGAI